MTVNSSDYKEIFEYLFTLFDHHRYRHRRNYPLSYVSIACSGDALYLIIRRSLIEVGRLNSSAGNESVMNDFHGFEQ